MRLYKNDSFITYLLSHRRKQIGNKICAEEKADNSAVKQYTYY